MFQAFFPFLLSCWNYCHCNFYRICNNVNSLNPGISNLCIFLFYLISLTRNFSIYWSSLWITIWFHCFYLLFVLFVKTLIHKYRFPCPNFLYECPPFLLDCNTLKKGILSYFCFSTPETSIFMCQEAFTVWMLVKWELEFHMVQGRLKVCEIQPLRSWLSGLLPPGTHTYTVSSHMKRGWPV